MATINLKSVQNLLESPTICAIVHPNRFSECQKRPFLLQSLRCENLLELKSIPRRMQQIAEMRFLDHLSRPVLGFSYLDGRNSVGNFPFPIVASGGRKRSERNHYRRRILNFILVKRKQNHFHSNQTRKRIRSAIFSLPFLSPSERRSVVQPLAVCGWLCGMFFSFFARSFSPRLARNECGKAHEKRIFIRFAKRECLISKFSYPEYSESNKTSAKNDERNKVLKFSIIATDETPMLMNLMILELKW